MVRMLSESPQLFVNNYPTLRATFDIEREMIEASTASDRKPDLSWSHFDVNGHFHAFNTAGELPTVDARYADVTSLDQEEPEEIFVGWFCQICGAMVEPKYVSSPPVLAHVPGRMSWGGSFEFQGPGFEFGEKVSIRLPVMRRFGIAQIIEVRRDADFLMSEFPVPTVRYSYVGIGELSERPR